MGFRPTSLGLKINLALLAFFIVAGVATATVLYFGFERTKTNATSRSREGLEELGQQQILTTVGDQASLGALQLQWASDAGQMAARYLVEERRNRSGDTPAPALVRNANGVLYDANPARRSDVALPNIAELTPAAQADIVDSQALDSLAPSVFSGYAGRIRGAGFDAIAFYYVSVNNVFRYYPPIGVQDIAPADTNVAGLRQEVGPEQNPERKTIWTEPYDDDAGQGLVISAYTPVFDGDVFLGVIGIDLSIANLIGVVNGVRLNPDDQSFAFYVDRSGDLLRSDAYDLLAFELSTQANQELAASIERMKAGEFSVDRVSIGGEEFFLAFAPLQEVGGSFAIAAPVSEITLQAGAITSEIETQADQTMTVVLTSMAVLFAVALVLASYLNRRMLLRPIEALVAGTRAVAGGDLGARIQVRGDDELSVLGHSFNQMTEEILQRDESLRNEVRERHAAQEELRALFAAITDRVIVFDREGRVVRLPETAAVPVGVATEDLPGMTLLDLVPAEQAQHVLGSIHKALADHVTVTEEYPYEVDDVTFWFSSAFSPISDDEVVMVARDITERVNASQALENQVAERTRELQTLLGVSRNVASTLELRPLLQVIIEQVRAIADYSRCSIFLLEGDSIVLLDSQTATSSQAVSLRIPLDVIQPLWDGICSGEPVIVEDVRGDSPLAAAYRRGSGDLLETAFRDIHSWMGVPLELQDRLIGMLTLSHEKKGFYSQHHASLVTAIATQVAVAVENARLYEQVQARSQELQTLLNVSRNVASTLELAPLLDTIVDQLKNIVDYSRCTIFEVSGDDLVSLGSHATFSEVQLETLRVSLVQMGLIWERINRGEAVLIDDVHDPEAELARQYRTAAGERMQSPAFQAIHSALGLPLVSKDRTIGMLVLTHVQPAFFTEHDAGLVHAVATQIAVAIDNARLYEQAQQLAAVEERQRLARELHDSVSQALYGIALGARTARTLLDRDPEKVVEPVDYVLSLAEAGLAEMRALIFELRPESLEIEGLVAALDKQIAATAARYGIEVASELGEEPDMSLGHKEIFYRIGQEALHNVVKHAHASRATVRFASDNGAFVLEVADNGAGFDPGQSFPGHMGLVSMTERAASIGAKLEVDSAPGAGTTVRLLSAARG